MTSFLTLSSVASLIFAIPPVPIVDQPATGASTNRQTSSFAKLGDFPVSLSSNLLAAIELKANQKPETFVDRAGILDKCDDSEQDWQPPDNEQPEPEPGPERTIDPVIEINPEEDRDPVIDPYVDEEPDQLPDRTVDPPQQPDHYPEPDQPGEPGLVSRCQNNEDKNDAA